MAKKRKDSRREISGTNADLSSVEKSEIMKLTKLAKSWEFTCTFCFKRYPSAQALGGHQNAHRAERSEEKRLFVRDPIGYRKRSYLRSLKGMKLEIPGGSSSSPNLHAASKECTNGTPGYSGEFNASSYGNNNFRHPSVFQDSPTDGEKEMALMNFFPPKELGLAERLGSHAEDAKGKACAEADVGGYGIELEKLDLTLKL